MDQITDYRRSDDVRDPCKAPSVTHFVTGVEGHEGTSQVAVRDVFDEPKAGDREGMWCR